MVRSRPAARGKDARSLTQLYYIAAVAALSAVLFAGFMSAQGTAVAMEGRAVELVGILDMNAMEQQASQGLPYSSPRQQELSYIEVVPARMQQLYDTPSVNAGAGGFTNAMLRTGTHKYTHTFSRVFKNIRKRAYTHRDMLMLALQSPLESPSAQAAHHLSCVCIMRVCFMCLITLWNATAPITDCSGLGCVTRVPGISASPGHLAQVCVQGHTSSSVVIQ